MKNFLSNHYSIRKKLMVLLLAVVVVGSGLLASVSGNTQAANITLNDARNCDANAIVYCGGMTPSEIQQKYYSNNTEYANIQATYKAFGISASDIDGLGGEAQAGLVSADGSVTINGQVVASNAVTAGRQFIAGSQSQTVPASYGGGNFTFYQRSTRLSFQSNSLQAFVVMRSGQFAFAILASCGNPVKATPAPAPAAPKPAPAPKAPIPIPPATPICTIPGETNLPANSPDCVPATPICTVPGKTNLTANSPDCQQTPQCTIPGETNLPVSSPDCVATPLAPTTPPPAAPAAPPTLPNTGSGAIISLFGGTSVIGTLIARLWMKRRSFGL
ncbi:MAG: hypothetical protein ACREGF_00950 [Candidatus Saccharimonadales bacterium]